MSKPDLPTNCREHANGRVKEIERRYANGEIDYECATFLCGCNASVSGWQDVDGKMRWQLDETIFWKEGQA